MILGLLSVLLVPLECIWEFSQKLVAKALHKAKARSLGLPRMSFFSRVMMLVVTVVFFLRLLRNVRDHILTQTWSLPMGGTPH